MNTEQEQDDGHAEQELLGRGVLVAVVDLLPHVEVVEGAGVELKGDPAHPVEHDEREEHVRDVGERPRDLLRHARHDVEAEPQKGDQDEMDEPGSCYFEF